ncbi:MAG: thiamine phosphate synthase [Planctomycetes bacterium B3_Pla]|nr:MAG: thiamine phosphate synthase [Planctomycetes bacterium B3_Pla]
MRVERSDWHADLLRRAGTNPPDAGKASTCFFDYSKSRPANIIKHTMESAVLRIIDANFNRAREAVRVIEEVCRFALNSAPLSSRAKQLRHELTRAIGELDAGRLIASRETPGDVGVAQTVEKQLGRGSLSDSLTAGCKRLTEALRALAEVIRIENESLAGRIEKLRYDAYTLEKDIVLFAEPREKFKRVGLYIVITSNLPTEVIYLTHKCADGGADCIQLRAKAIEDDKLYAIAAEFVKICKDADVLSVINDRVDVAVAAGADGLHLGQNDLPIEQARKLQKAPLIIGKSTHSPVQLRAACDERPTYAALGPVFATGTKPDVPPVGLGYVRQAGEILADTGIGNVAIGGITLDNVEQVLNAGAASISVCAAVTKASDPTAACRALKEKIEAFRRE